MAYEKARGGRGYISPQHVADTPDDSRDLRNLIRDCREPWKIPLHKARLHPFEFLESTCFLHGSSIRFRLEIVTAEIVEILVRGLRAGRRYQAKHLQRIGHLLADRAPWFWSGDDGSSNGRALEAWGLYVGSVSGFISMVCDRSLRTAVATRFMEATLSQAKHHPHQASRRIKALEHIAEIAAPELLPVIAMRKDAEWR